MNFIFLKRAFNFNQKLLDNQDNKINNVMQDYSKLKNEMFNLRNGEQRKFRNQKKLLDYELRNENQDYEGRSNDIQNIMLLNRLQDVFV